MINLKFSKAIFLSSLYFLLLLIPVSSFSQYILNGAATQNSCNCYTLTPAAFTQAGSVWNANKINLNNPFDFSFNVFLGCQDVNGADGIVFMLQPISTSIGSTGEGMGFMGITPSIGISLDTWQNLNLNDPVYDHISIQANGNPSHGSDLAGPIQASASNDNIEDCQWHVFRISWDPVTHWLRAYFDGQLRVEAQVNLIATIFNNDPNVFWGFTAATGGANNLQQFCTALNPNFSTNFGGNGACFSATITFTDNSVSFAPIQSWYWDFGDGTTSTLRNPPPHLYASPGIYQVKEVITGLDGCISDTLKKNITIGSKPIADFQVFDTCMGKPARIVDRSTNMYGTIDQWTWLLDGLVTANNQQPVLIASTPGTHTIKLVVKTNIGCESDTVTKTFIVNPAPVINVSAPDGCADQPINFFANQTDNLTTITQWNWDLGDGTTSQLQNPVHSYSPGGNFNVGTTAMASNGCVSAVNNKIINVASVFAKASNDTLILKNIPFPLHVEYGGNFNGTPSFLWSPSTGLNNPLVSNPTSVLQDDITYVVTVTTSQGCDAKDSVKITVFKGSAVYVPTGFTPNSDGKNDYLRGLYIGIKKVHYFRIYNRWGQQVFSTTSLSEGWDGTIKGVKQQTGTYAWMLKAEDIAGKIYEMKGVSTLIR
ncbi:MAG TPA: PKD domain-containing protein [Chitinophagaceae bacterium]|nr:PKD domain-containing protein [Chitinophagaceae bacterium]